MNPTTALRARLSVADRDEIEQARLRISIGGTVGLYLLLKLSLGEQNTTALLGVGAWLIVRAGLFAAILIWPSVSVARRLLGTLADVGITTFAIFVVGEAGAVLLFVCLFVSFGDGLRYGRRYLLVSQLLTVVGFSIVLLFSDFWSRHLAIGFGFMVALVVLPFYVSKVAERLVEARKRADEASQARAEEAARAKDRLLAYVSRKTGEPLSAIIAELNESTRQEE
jgi:two-component system, sensor histidine kinase RpfC